MPEDTITDKQLGLTAERKAQLARLKVIEAKPMEEWTADDHILYYQHRSLGGSMWDIGKLLGL